MERKGKIIIKLKSDLCVSSGYSYAGLIDRDICFDRYGLPYIPARRLKGCMRQNAEEYLLDSYMDYKDIESIFGVKGDNQARGIRISNAYVAEYENLTKEIAPLIEKKYISTKQILEQYTHVLGQTELKDGLADDNSLRYTRVVDKINPIDKKELIFTADVIFDDEYKDKIEAIIKITRNIGLKRNRGLGSVECLLECNELYNKELKILNGENNYVISYKLVNIDPLMLSNQSEDESIKYISGQAILGYLAGEYIKVKKLTPEEASKDEVFADLFLNGTTQFMNLVPSKKGKSYYPAPTYINKLKKTHKLVNCIDSSWLSDEKWDKEENLENELNPKNGNQPKKLKGRFAYISEDYTADELEVSTSMVYHHSKEGISKNGEKGLLYSIEVIDAGQEFSGHILTKEKYKSLILDLLKSSTIYLGKSKSAQYGRCKYVEDQNMQSFYTEYSFNEGDKIVVTLLSDGIFMNEVGEYTVYEDELYGLIANDLGLVSENKKNRLYVTDTNKTCSSMISTKTAVGYQSRWNLRKMSIPAISAGSCFIYEINGPCTISKRLIGERNVEGYGLIRIDKYDEMQYEVKEIGEDNNNSDIKIERSKKLLEDILLQDIIDALILDKINCPQKYEITSSELGRITLMLIESVNDSYKEEGTYKSKENFKRRVDSIKTESVKEEATKIYDEVTKLKEKLTQNQIELINILGINDRINNLLDERWEKYAMTILTHQKYIKSI